MKRKHVRLIPPTIALLALSLVAQPTSAQPPPPPWLPGSPRSTRGPTGSTSASGEPACRDGSSFAG